MRGPLIRRCRSLVTAFSLLVVTGSVGACAVGDACGEKWMVFVVDEQQRAPGPLRATLCDEADECGSPNLLWVDCGGTLCGAPDAFVCLASGAWSYQLSPASGGDAAAEVERGAVVLPEGGAGCRGRLHVNTPSPAFVPLSCGAGPVAADDVVQTDPADASSGPDMAP